jgi:hypothetical protein
MNSDARTRAAFLAAIALMVLTLLVMAHQSDGPRSHASSASSSADR